MKITNELVGILRKLHNNMEKVELDSFAKQVKQVSEKYDLTYQEVLNLLYNEEFLKKEISKQTSQIDIQIEELEKQLETLREEKLNMGSLICEFHGHTFFKQEKFDDKYYCKNCGESRHNPDDKFLLKKRNMDKAIFYKGERR